jgi:hypothetical protein
MTAPAALLQQSPVPADVPPPQSWLEVGDVGLVQAATARMAIAMVSRAMRRDMVTLRWVSGVRTASAKSNGRCAYRARICRQRRALAVSRINPRWSAAAVCLLAHCDLGRMRRMGAL